MDRSEQTKKNQAINLYTWGLELLSDGGHVRDADKVGWMLIENAATQGDRDAQNYLGDAYFYSYKKDEKAAFWYTEAAFWYTKAAEQGLPEAQAMLGMLYLLGRGVTRNYAKARQYFEQALQGNEVNVEAAVAQYWLGQMYKEGIGVPKDRKKGEKLIRLAAINGYAPHGTPREIRQQWERNKNAGRRPQFAKKYTVSGLVCRGSHVASPLERFNHSLFEYNGRLLRATNPQTTNHGFSADSEAAFRRNRLTLFAG